MITMEQINGEISVLEQETPTHIVMQKLASLYTVRDHMEIGGNNNSNAVIIPSQTIKMDAGESDFLKAVQGKDYADVLKTMGELMEVLLATNKRLYDAVMRKLS